MATTTTDTSAAALSAALAAPPVEKDEFGDAFASFTAPETPATEAAAQATQEAQDGKEAPATGDEVVTEIEGVPDPSQTATETAKTPEELAAEAAAAAKAADTEAKGKPATDDALARLADMISQRTQPAEPRAPAQTQTEPAPLYSADEVAQLQNFYKEWPEVAPAVATLLKGAITSTEQRIYAEVARVIGPKLKLIDQLADNMVYTQIKEKLPDYDDTLEEQVAAWVKTQPGYLQAAYTSVMQNGTADDISDLVQRYRTETGSAATGGDRTTNGTQSPPPPKQAASLSPAAKKAAAALAPVNSKRTGSTQVEPQSFDEAFDVFAKAG